jgi:magnesium-transporting ATPase (P-type)
MTVLLAFHIRTLVLPVQVTDGDARVLITAVGPNSEWGMIMEKVTVEEETETPLQEKLGALQVGSFFMSIQYLMNVGYECKICVLHVYKLIELGHCIRKVPIPCE